METENDLRILIFEDNKFVRHALKEFLCEFGYDVYTFEDPVASPLYKKSYCDCRFGSACADVIISDVNMPFLSGLDFMRNQVLKGCKVKSRALMSGDWTHNNLLRAQRLGCRIFSKPLVIKEIVQWIENSQKRENPFRELSDRAGTELLSLDSALLNS